MKVFLILAFLFAGFVLVILKPAASAQRRAALACEAKGGRFFVGRGEDVCLARSAVMP